MKIRNVALVLGAAFTVAAGGFAATACSSNNPAVTGGGYDASTVRDSSTGNDSGNTGNDSGMMGDDGGMAPDCGKPPSLHADTNPGEIFCSYGADGGKLNCATGTQCCVGGSLGGGMYAGQDCVTFGAACDNPDGGGYPVQCSAPADCAANDAGSGAVCCLQGAVDYTVPGCFPKYGKGSGIKCEQSTNGACATGEFQVCSSQADCPSGTVCTAAKWKILQIGVCIAGDGGM